MTKLNSVKKIFTSSLSLLLFIVAIMPIAKAQHCLDYNGSICLSCESGYLLSNNVCLLMVPISSGGALPILVNAFQPVKQTVVGFNPALV